MCSHRGRRRYFSTVKAKNDSYNPKFFQLAKYLSPVRKKYFANWKNKFW